jgi:hypothetical protein
LQAGRRISQDKEDVPVPGAPAPALKRATLSLDAKLAAYEANRDRVDKLRDLNRDVLEGKEGAVSDVGAVTTGAELVAARVVLTDSDIANAKRVLLRQPQTRRTEHVKELVQWLRASDLFYGLSKSERTDLMMGVTGRLVEEHDVIVSAGDSHPKIHVVVTGCCEMYHFLGGECNVAAIHHISHIALGALWPWLEVSGARR